MKKFTFFISSFLISLCCMAQSDHMKFMGIPLDGTINSFQNKLSAKGITPDDKLNKSLQVGVRGFKGNFAGHEAEIFVYYDAKSKIVYRAKACIESEIKNVAEQNYNTIKSQLKDKYYDKSIIDTDTYEGHESLHFLLLFGVIDLYFNSYSEGYPTIYSVHIDYSDIENYNKYKNSVMDDL